MCRKLELIHSSSFSHYIGSILHLASTTNLRLWQLSESQNSAGIITNPLHPRTSYAQDIKPPAFLRLNIFFRKRNTISFWEIASCCCWFSSLLRGFFSGFSGFPPSTKTNTPNSNSIWKQWMKSHSMEMPLQIPIIIIIIIIIIIAVKLSVCTVL